MHRSALFGLGLAALLGSACSSASSGARGGQGGDPVEESESQGGSGGATSVVASSSSTGGPVDLTTGSTGGGDPGTNTCDHAPDADEDQDGFTVADGDCNDCDPNVNPGALEVLTAADGGEGGAGGAGGGSGEPPKPADEDCDGEVDNVAPLCDDGLTLEDVDPENGAKAIGICTKSDGKTAGLLEAKYVGANGGELAPGTQVGILDGFGPNVSPRKGSRLLALSTGRARIPGQSGACGYQSCSNHSDAVAPTGFPQDSASCQQASDIHDDIALEVKLKSPTNATGYKFLFDFYSFEFPEFVCTSFNDQFIALAMPAPEGALNGNISFDSQKNPVSVNIAFFDVCTPSPEAPNSPCTLGPAELAGTGFDVWDDAGATSWLETQAPVKGGEELTLRFAIWDTGDQSWDSTVLVDGFEWIANGGTVVIETKPNIPK